MTRHLLGTALALGLMTGAAVGPGLLPLPALAQEGEDKVVATVNGEPILRSEVLAAAANLPAEYQAQMQLIFPLLVDRLIDQKVIMLAAADAGLSDDEEVQRRLVIRKNEVMRDVYLERMVAEEVTEESLQARYQSYVAENPPQVEVSARHILLDSEEEADKVIVELDGGADFAELATQRSKGPSSTQGGDLGFFTKDQMVPEFAEAAFGMEIGAHSEKPVQTQFGWHVIKVEDRRSQPQATYEEMIADLTNEMTREIVQSKVELLRGEAEVELLDPAAKPPANPAETPEGTTPEGATPEGTMEEGEKAQ
jgi:peptidyl-prolyl cis-trans isomerase C